MKTINSLQLDGRATIATISQSQNQFDNYSVTLYELDGKKYLVEDLMNDANYYELDADDDISDPVAFVRGVASDWAGNDDNTDLELIRWGLHGADDFEVADDYAGACKIIIEGSYYGYSPVDYAAENYETIIFDSRESAQDWIGAQEQGAYCTSHNEAGRPTFTIVEA